MNDKRDKDNGETDDLTAEIRRGRSFQLSEAIGREAGGSLKGASPVPISRQLLLRIDELLASALVDIEASLTLTIMSRLADSPTLLTAHKDDPRGALISFLDRVLATPSSLAELVRQTDVRWGRDYNERPHFERDHRPPQPGDPYTIDGVRALLTNLRRTLNDSPDHS